MIINENLKSTGDDFYQNIAEALKKLFDINGLKAREIVTKIRTEYSRRKNLIQLINKL
jgi:hypothetical protein